MVNDYVGYKALFEGIKNADAKSADAENARARVLELRCMAHVMHKFFDLHAANESLVALEALNRIAALYAIERHADEKEFDPSERAALRQAKTQSLLGDKKRCLPLRG